MVGNCYQYVACANWLAGLSLNRTVCSTYFAERHELINSRNASSAALAVSSASATFCLASNCAFCTICLLGVRCSKGRLLVSCVCSGSQGDFVGRSLMTPVASHRLVNGNLPRGDSIENCGSLGNEGVPISLFVLEVSFANAGRGVVTGVLTSRRDPLNEGRALRRVMLPRSFLIDSTLCIPSGAFGFLSLIYKSRCRPRDDDVKAWPQNGQLLSFGAGTLGVPSSEACELGSAMVNSSIAASLLGSVRRLSARLANLGCWYADGKDAEENHVYRSKVSSG